jgi:hypothetical protein
MSKYYEVVPIDQKPSRDGSYTRAYSDGELFPATFTFKNGEWLNDLPELSHYLKPIDPLPLSREQADAKVLLEALEYLVRDVRNKPNHTRYGTALKKAIAAITEYKASKPSQSISREQWINVKDKLPEVNKWVLVFNGSGVDMARYVPDESYDPNEPIEDQILEPSWSDQTSEYISDPTHWQPLPEPPKQ